MRAGTSLGVASLLLFACAPAREPSRFELPGPARAGGDHALEASRANAECERCHVEIAEEWRLSLHHGSFTNTSFQQAFEREPLAFCQGCHAPEADPEKPPARALAELGVGCVSCHSTPAGVLAGPSDGRPERAPHTLVRLPAQERDGACAGCHEFAFPDALARGRVELMQSTLTEHRRSIGASLACVDCHMPRGGLGHRTHGFAVSRDPAFLRRAVTVEAGRRGQSRVRIVLRPAWLGHAFPTGDLFRRLVVSAEAVGADYQVLGAAERYLTRHFSRKRGAAGQALLELTKDDRVGLHIDRPSELELELGERAQHVPIAWRVAYQRVAHPGAVGETGALVEAEVEIGAGVLPAAAKTDDDPATPATGQHED
jgi:hypothetical protein